MVEFFIYIAIILFIITFVQIVGINELLSDLTDKKTEEVSEKDNKRNAWLMLIGMIGFFVYFVYQFIASQNILLPIAASEHGPEIDRMFNITVLIITIVFFITHGLMAWYGFRYYFRKDNKATFYPHNNKLEIAWTVVPTIVLTGLIFYGLVVWGNVMNPSSKEAMVIEVFAKQFQWTVRYPGGDEELGKANYKLIKGTNALGLDSSDTKAWDDIVTRELHLPVNKSVLMVFRSQDVIHSAYLPHFRVQMNCVPGMTTQFQFTPTMTTDDMRREINNEEFDYALICNKICGAAHYTMRMKVVVESEEDYKQWLSEQSVFYAEKISSQPAEIPIEEAKGIKSDLIEVKEHKTTI
ncbi:MAG: cytochrome c oxidase subunit II [Proteobacteria bacterium]|nr:cytochrome c oxidase subunit II [Pseudomonadota bacterium]